jgi:ABC-type phosphate/phosphonate transport system ATPase subunit
VIGLQDGVKKFEGRPAELNAQALHEIYAMEVL